MKPSPVTPLLGGDHRPSRSMKTDYPLSAGGLLAVADTLSAAWLGSGAALLAHLDAGRSAGVWVAGAEPGLAGDLSGIGLRLRIADPPLLTDTAAGRGLALTWLAECLQRDAIQRIHLCTATSAPLRAAVVEAARRAGLDLWLCAGISPLDLTHALVDAELLRRKRDLAARLPQTDLARMEALQGFYGATLGTGAAEGYRLVELEELHRRSANTLCAPPSASGAEDAWPLVSVIVRSLDRRPLAEALESLACQTYPRLEAVIVNAKGGQHSEPRTARTDLAIRVVDEGGRALSRAAAANTGLRAARGDYALFLDDDDLLYPSHIESLLRTLRASPGRVAAYGGVRVEHYEAAGRLVELGELNDPFDRRRLAIQNFLPIHAVLFDLAWVRAAGCRFDEDLAVYEDWDFWLQLSALSDLTHEPAVGAVYRNYGGSGLGLEVRERSAAVCRERVRAKWLAAASPGLASAVLDYAADETNPWIRNWRRRYETQASEHQALLQTERRSAGERIQGLQDRLDALTRSESALQERVRRREEELAAARTESIALSNHLRFLRESTSWRITRPLRLLSVTARQAGRITQGTARLARDHGGWSHLTSRALRSVRRYGLRVSVERALVHLGLGRCLAQADGALDSPPPATRVDHRPPPPVAPLTPEHAPVDIVVCVHNALTDVQRCLGSVLGHTEPPYRLILVDDGSGAETRAYLDEVATDPRCALLRNEVAKGYTLAANMGLRASSAPYVILLNSDTLVADQWLPRLLRCAQSDPSIAMVGPLSNTASWQSVPRLEERGDWARNPLSDGWDVSDMGEAIRECGAPIFPRLPFLNGFCLLIRREAIESIGLFDEEHFARGYGEENDFSLRLYEAGWSLAVADDVYVYHAQSRSYSDERRRHLGALATEALARKHGQALVDRLSLQCRQSRVMAGIRARSAVCPTRTELRRDGSTRFGGKRVLFVLPSVDAGGGANIIVSEAERMLAMGVDVAIANLAANREGFEQAYDHLRLPVHYVRHPDELPKIAERYDAIVASIYYTVAWLRPLADRRVVLGYYVQDFEPGWFAVGTREHEEALASYSLFPGLRLFCKTDWNRREVLDRTGAKCWVLGPSVDVDLFRPRRERAVGDRVLIAGMVRPYSSYRSPEMTMRILSRIKAAYPDDCEILTFGVDALDPSFQRLKPAVHLQHLGKLSSPQLATVLDQVDIFVDFSTYQAMGLTAMEAMACGCAVIVPIAGGTTEFARHERNALVVDTSDESLCYAALERLVKDGALRQTLAENALADIQAFHPEGAAYNLLTALFSPAAEAMA